MSDIRLGIVGTNFISDWLCECVAPTPGIRCTAVYSRREETGRAFADKYGIDSVFTDYDRFLAGPIDAVYVANPNFLHEEFTRRALMADKHVLVEKPAALTADGYRELLSLADSQKKILVEAIRPGFDPAMDAIRSSLPEIGEIRRFCFDFCQYSSRYDRYKEGTILNAFQPALGNAAIMDIGVYPIHCCVKLFGAPRRIQSQSLMLPNGMEGMGTVLLDYGSFQGTIFYSKINDSAAPSTICGEAGDIVIGKLNALDGVTLHKRGHGEKVLIAARTENNMIYEVAAFVRMIRGEASPEPVNSDTLNALSIIDTVRKQNGIVFA